MQLGRGAGAGHCRLARLGSAGARRSHLQINFQKLSPFQQAGPLFDGQCVYVLLRYPVCKVGSGNSAFKYNRAFMGAQDIPSVFSYLQSNGYHIDTSMTSMLQDSAINVGGVSETRYSGNRKMIAIVNS